MTQRHNRENDRQSTGPELHVPGPHEREDVLLSLAEAATAFSVSVATLRRLISADLMPAQLAVGIRGREWRVATSALERAGYTRRPLNLTEDRSEVHRLAEALRTERARTAHLDGELGYAQLTIGRLRGRLREAGIDPDDMFGAEPDDLHRTSGAALPG